MKWLSLDVDLKKPEKYHLIMWKFLGIIPPKSAGYKRNLYIAASIILHISTAFCCSLTLICAVIRAKTFPEFCKALFVTVPFVGISVIFINTLTILSKLSNFSQIGDRLYRRVASDDELAALKYAIHQGHELFIGILVLFAVATMLAIIGSAVISVMYMRIFPFPAFYPFDWQNNYFWMCFIHQMLSIITATFECVSSDTYVIVYMQYLIGHINALCIRVKKIGRIPEASCSELVDCIKDHQDILR